MVLESFAALGRRQLPQPAEHAWHQNGALWLAVGAGVLLATSVAVGAIWIALNAQPPSTGDWDYRVSLP
ncbi:MAG: hypothetical protein JXR83_13345, partial [Deltaproteobacteria bacterium]|nr:hypothetical protein [Deltaproteobacteria bacterium]